MCVSVCLPDTLWICGLFHAHPTTQPLLLQVMRNDLVPRFSTAAVEAMQQELLEIDYKGLLHEDLMEHEVG